MAHSTPDFAAPRLQDPDAAAPLMVEELRSVLGVGAPAWSRVQRWTYAKPVGRRDALFHLGPSRVGLCGDGWGASKVEAAWLSGTRLGQALAALDG